MKIYGGRESFYQWDLNQMLISDFKVGEEVHFHNIRQSNALVVVAYEYDGDVVVDVPNILLQSSHPIVAYRCTVDGDMLSTVEEQAFEVEQRPKPDDYVYTETEVLSYRALEDRVTELEKNGGGGGGSVVVDDVLDGESKNPISNRAVTEAIETVQSGIDGIGGEVSVQREDIDGLYNKINQHAHFKGYFATNAKIQSTEATPNDFAYSAESGTKWVCEENEDGNCVWVDTETPVPDQMTPASDTTPLVNGEASVGEENAYARGDHRHPTDTTRASVAELNKVKEDVSKIKPIISNNVGAESVEILITNNNIISYGVISTSLAAAVEPASVGFTSVLYFTTPSEIPENYSTFPEDICFKGDSTDGGFFVPEADTRYTIVFDFDGNSAVGYVSGVKV